MRLILLAALAVFSTPLAAQETSKPERVIDVHLHMYPEDMVIPPAPYRGTDTEGMEATMPKTGAEHREMTIAALRRNNVVLAMGSAAGGADNESIAEVWSATEGLIFRPGLNNVPMMKGTPASEIEPKFRDGTYFALAELGLQYRGATLGEERFHAYLEMAERLQIPVGVHTGLGPPGQAHGFAPEFRLDAGKPLHLEQVLIRHPKLKLWAMHAGYPWEDEMFAIMQQFESVYIDVSPLIWIMPEKPFYAWLERLVDLGMGQRILFGTDQMFWPQAIDAAVDRIENAPFLSREQKDDIFYYNAVRFFGAENLQLEE